jgi:hypothetical protein
MRLWKRAPATFCALAIISIVTELALNLIPEAGPLLSKVIAPVVECGLLYASVAVATGGRARLAMALTPFRADASALAAIVVASGLTFAAEWFAADALAGINLLRPEHGGATLEAADVLGIYAIGMLASLPLTFVPFAVLFEHAGFASAFARSVRGFALNIPGLLLYGAVSYVLLVVGLATMTLGLVIALPLWAASSYVAWREIYPAGDPAVGSE